MTGRLNRDLNPLLALCNEVDLINLQHLIPNPGKREAEGIHPQNNLYGADLF
jgi:HAMP domain-containing protein